MDRRGSIINWMIAVSLLASVVIGGAGAAGASGPSAPPDATFCVGVNNSQTLNARPSSLLAALGPLSVTSARTELPYFQSERDLLQQAVAAARTATHSAPTAVLALAWTKAAADYSSEYADLARAVTLLERLLLTKDAGLVARVTNDLDAATALVFAANGHLSSAPAASQMLSLCSPWEYGTGVATELVMSLTGGTLKVDGQAITATELRSAIKKLAKSPRVALVATTGAARVLTTARLSVTTTKYRIYVCASFSPASVLHPVLVLLCPRQT